MYYQVTNCRSCGFGPPKVAGGIKIGTSNLQLEKVFSLGVQPLANDFQLPDGEHAGFAPLEVLHCPRCGLAQLSVVVRAEILYSHYPYVTSKSVMMKEHFKRLWGDCYQLAKNKTVLEIGSNDGDFLDFCRFNGAEAVCGIEPAENLAAAARKKGIQTICDFFNPISAAMALQTMPDIGLIFARHVFCHVDDWLGFMANLQLVAKENTLICIEVPYLKDQLEQNSFDQIYHEHLSFMSVGAMKALLNSGPFSLRKILHYPIHGGAIVLIIQRSCGSLPEDRSVNDYHSHENINADTWAEFGLRSKTMISELADCIRNLARGGQRVVGYGASAKSTVWINAMGLTKKELRCVYDCTNEKVYRLIPGTDIPIVHEGAFYVDDPNYAVLFAWNFAAEVISKQDKWVRSGGRFIVPVPSLKFIGLDSNVCGA